MKSHVLELIPMYILVGDIVNVLNIVNVQTYFVYVCYTLLYFYWANVEIKDR